MSALRIHADIQSDVLYLSLGPPVPGSVEDDSDGILCRRCHAQDKPCGVTVLSWVERGGLSETDLLKVGTFLGTPQDHLRLALLPFQTMAQRLVDTKKAGA